MSKLINYMPPFLQGVREYNRIFDAEDIELNNLETNMNLLLTEVIVKLASSFGLDRYENIYGIKTASENVEARRAAILTKINSRVPFTYKWLYSQLEENFGKNGFEININYDNYTIEIVINGIYSEVADILIESFYDKLPANMQQSFRLIAKSDYNMGAVVVQEEFDTLTIDTSIIEQNEEIDNNANVGMVITQIESNKMIIDNSVIEETENITQNEEIGGAIIQKEKETLTIDNSIIIEESIINNNSYIASSVIQKENIKLKEE